MGGPWLPARGSLSMADGVTHARTGKNLQQDRRGGDSLLRGLSHGSCPHSRGISGDGGGSGCHRIFWASAVLSHGTGLAAVSTDITMTLPLGQPRLALLHRVPGGAGASEATSASYTWQLRREVPTAAWPGHVQPGLGFWVLLCAACERGCPAGGQTSGDAAWAPGKASKLSRASLEATQPHFGPLH